MKLKINSPKELGIFEPDPQLEEMYPGLLVARVIADCSANEVAIPVINTTGNDFKLPSGTALGKWEAVEVQSEVSPHEDSGGDLPAHVVD